MKKNNNKKQIKLTKKTNKKRIKTKNKNKMSYGYFYN